MFRWDVPAIATEFLDFGGSFDGDRVDFVDEDGDKFTLTIGRDLLTPLTPAARDLLAALRGDS